MYNRDVRRFGSNERRRVSAPERGRQEGFTLIELMIVLVVVAILATVGLPAYQNTVMKTWRNKAVSCLAEMSQSMERRFTGQLNYLGPAGAAGQLPPNTCTVDDDMAQRYAFSFTADPTATQFTLQAVPQNAQAAQDVRCATLTMNQVGVRTESGTGDVEECF